MDIFDIAQQGVELEQKEIEEKKAEEEAAALKKKNYKFNIFGALDAAARKDYSFYKNLSDDDKKNFQPHMLNLWMGRIWSKGGNRAFKGNDPFYATIVQRTNAILNPHCYKEKGLVWLLACTIQKQINYKYDKNGKKHVESFLPFDVDYIKSQKREAEIIYSSKLIKYMADELYSSTEQIYDLIENGLITEEAMKSIEKDLATLEDQSKKKKKKSLPKKRE